MDRSFSPRHNFQRSPNFQNRFRMQSNHHQFNQTTQGMQFRSPQSSPSFNHRNIHPNSNGDVRQRNSSDPSNFSPNFQGSPRPYSPRNKSPYYNKRNSFNDSWNNLSGISADSSANSSVYFADISGSPHSFQNNNDRFQRAKHSKKSAGNDCNPGHSDNIEDYLHPSMLEDPWKKDMAEFNRKRDLSGMEVS